MEELWKDIEGYEGLYQISNMGRVKSLARPCKGFGFKFTVDRILSQKCNSNGYKEILLSKEGKHKTVSVHRLVAIAFLPNPDKLPMVNHKDENKSNNCIDNLEWCTAKYNANYGTHVARMREKLVSKSKSVYQIDKQCGMIIRWWDCAEAAGKKLKICPSYIRQVCKGIYMSAGGFAWRYADEYDKEQAV